MRRALLAALVPVALGGVTGCATLRATLHGYETGPHGIARPQHRLREALATGDFVRALAWRENDALLERLTRATSAYYAHQYLRAGALLDSAALESDDRVTERLAHDALAILTNDNARPWRPRRTERLFIPYYGMLAYAQAEQWEDAAVEARRILALLTQVDEDRDTGERSLHAALAHLAGAVLERAGRDDEAAVAYRASHRVLDAAPERLDAPASDEGELLVVVERGFVAHRVTERVDVYVGDDDDRRRDRDERRGDEAGSQRSPVPPAGDPRRTANASSVIGAIAAPTSDSARPPRRRKHDDDAEYWIAIAFPALRHSARPWGPAAQVKVEHAEDRSVRLGVNVDDAAEADERRDRLAMLARATARAGAKYALAKAARDKKGEVAGTLANYGASLLERADVRSWHLLPQELQMVRMRLPAGAHVVRLDLADASGPHTVELGTVQVRPGRVTIAPFRVWRDRPAGAPGVTP